VSSYRMPCGSTRGAGRERQGRHVLAQSRRVRAHRPACCASALRSRPRLSPGPLPPPPTHTLSLVSSALCHWPTSPSTRQSSGGANAASSKPSDADVPGAAAGTPPEPADAAAAMCGS
jgi:hypothetical protein